MMQHSELKEQFSRIERDIEEAANACDANTRLPQKLKDCVTQWKQHTVKAKPVFESNDNRKIISCVDDLEKIGERAEAALNDVIGPDYQIRSSVMHANSQLADLARKLH